MLHKAKSTVRSSSSCCHQHLSYTACLVLAAAIEEFCANCSWLPVSASKVCSCNSVLQTAARSPVMFQVFFCKYNDPLYVKMEKLEIMIKLANERNIDQVLQQSPQCSCVDECYFEC